MARRRAGRARPRGHVVCHRAVSERQIIHMLQRRVGTDGSRRSWRYMRADRYRRKADRARALAMQARDPFFKISYQELGRDWAALAEEEGRLAPSPSVVGPRGAP